MNTARGSANEMAHQLLKSSNQRVQGSENIYHDFPADLPLWRSPESVLAANEIGSRVWRDQEIKKFAYGD